MKLTRTVFFFVENEILRISPERKKLAERKNGGNIISCHNWGYLFPLSLFVAFFQQAKIQNNKSKMIIGDLFLLCLGPWISLAPELYYFLSF